MSPFSGFAGDVESWNGEATFDLVGPSSFCEDTSLPPPTADKLEYCYDLVKGSVNWQFRGTRVTQPLAPSSDEGIIALRIKGPHPHSLGVQLSPKQGAHVMTTPDGPHPAFFEGMWLFAHGDIGDRWQLAGSKRLCASGGCQGWTWDVEPS